MQVCVSFGVLDDYWARLPHLMDVVSDIGRHRLANYLMHWRIVV